MKTNFKTFAHKLTALFLAVIMAVSVFTGAFTAYAAESSARNYHDQNLAANFMTWAETTDEQTAEALLDWADLYLSDLMTSLLGTDTIKFNYSIATITIDLNLRLDSVDGLIDAVDQANNLLKRFGGLIGGDVNNIDLSAMPNDLKYSTDADDVISKCGKSYRARNSAKDIIMALAKTIYMNSNDNGSNKNVIGQVIKGGFNLGSILTGVLGSDVYTLLKDKVFNSSLHLNLWDGYQSNLVYNIVAELILHLTKWYSEEEIAAFEASLQGNGGTKWNFDNELFKKLTTELMQQINVEITYPTNLSKEVGDELKDTSRTRYALIQELGSIEAAEAATSEKVGASVTFDRNIHYTSDGNVYIFQYGKDALNIDKEDSLLKIAYEALSFAWKTCLKPTVGIVHVNYDTDRGHGSNFDNNFYYWMRKQNRWDNTNWKSNYSKTNVEAWAEAVYKDYKAADADEFLGYVRNTFEYDRTVREDAQNNWRDIDPTQLFGKLRYNPLADLYFNMQTGPINLYFMETGAPNITKFFDESYTKDYTNIINIINDVLVAAVKDFFPQSSNIGLGDGENTVITNLDYPTLKETGSSTSADKIAETLVENAVNIFEYAANAADENILNAFYVKNSKTTHAGNLTEQNFEEAMIPLLIACIQRITIDKAQEDEAGNVTKEAVLLADFIHPEKWDACADAEGVAYVALEEYLSYVLPDKDYSVLVKLPEDNNGVYGVTLGAIEAMARDAVGYLLSSIVPCRDKNGNEWDVYSAPVEDDTTLYDILNSVVCYYAGMDNYTVDNTTGKGVASLLGVVDGQGNCLVTIKNSLWQNLDAVANKALPILGTLITGTVGGKVDSEELIYNKIIKGVLDIGPNSGVTTILKQILTIFTAPPLQKGVDVMVYDDILADTVNALFGARDSRQGYKVIIPKSNYYGDNASTPFDQLVSSNILAKYSGGDSAQNGILGILFSNIYEFFGGNYPSYSTDAMRKGTWTGAMFAVKAVNNFIPSFVPQLSNHKFNAATVSIDNPSRTGVVADTKIPTANIKITNNARGLNRFWRDKSGNMHRDPRYYIIIRNLTVKEGGKDVSNIAISAAGYKDKVVNPEETLKIPFTGTYVSGTQNLTYTITYDVFEAEGDHPAEPETKLYTGIQAKCFMFLSDEASWESSFFNAIDDSQVAYNSTGLLASNTTPSTTANSTYINAYNKFIVSAQTPENMNDKGIAITSTSNTGGIDSLFSYIADDAEPAYAVNGNELATTKSTAAQLAAAKGGAQNLVYADFDAATGDLLHRNRQDIKFEGDEDWDDNDYNGYTTEQINQMIEDATTEDGEGNKVSPKVELRTHVAYTLEDALADQIVQAVDYTTNKDGSITYNHIYVNPSKVKDDTVSTATSVKGISIINLNAKVANATSWYKWLKYDGIGGLSPQTFVMNIGANVGNNIITAKTTIIVANDTGATELANVYNTSLRELAPYGASDFKDYNGSTSSIYTNVQNAFSNVVKAISQPVTLENAESLISTNEDVISKSSVTSKTGDDAFKPMPSTEALTNDVVANATVKNGYYYIDEACTMPIYMNEALTEADVVDGKDAVGQKVELKDGKYVLTNEPSTAYKWTTIYGAPYYGPVTDGSTAVNEKGEDLYDRVQYQYYTADGDKVSSGDNWVYKFAITTSQVKANNPATKTDYRGFYQKQIDTLNYWMNVTRTNIKSESANDIVTKIMDVRAGMDNVDYIVASYEKMVQVAREGEKLIDKNVSKDENGKEVVTYSTSKSSTEINEAISIFERYYRTVDSEDGTELARMFKRDYEGRAINAEIKCATGLDYDALSSTEANEDGNGAEVRAAANTAVKYGVVNARGVLVNEAASVYTTKSWNNYVKALAHAVAIANAKDASISATYGAKKELQIAENKLEIDNTINVSGTLFKAADAKGATATKIAVAGASISVDGVEVAKTEEDGTFTIPVTKGTTEITISGDSIVTRTVTLSGENTINNAAVCVVAYDFNNDGKINTVDASLFSKKAAKADVDAFKAMFNKKIAYTQASLD